MIRTQYPKIIPLIWDDMLRTWPASSIATSELSDYIEPVIWVYGDNITRLVPLSYWYWYDKFFLALMEHTSRLQLSNFKLNCILFVTGISSIFETYG